MTLSVQLVGHVSDGDPQSLLNWLRLDRDLRGAVGFETSTARPGEMGGVASTLSVALGSGGAGVALASALSTWLRSRSTDVKAKIASRNGTVTIDVQRAKDPTQVLEMINKITHDLDA